MTTINVTAEHIRMGAQHDCRKCPVALAIKDVVADDVDVHVDVDEVVLVRRNYGETLELPDEVGEFIDRFDDSENDEVVEPFSFEIDIPKELLR